MRTQEVSVLKANDLKCVKGNSELFSGLDFSVQSGEALVVEGSNGSGKTSLLRILCGFNQPATGNITWCDEPIEKHEDYQQQISYIGHQSGVKLDLTVLENLIFAQRLVGTNRKESEIKEIIRTVGLFKQRNVLARKLSAGQKRRVALARLQLEDRMIWILDEPLTALDKDFVTEFEMVLKKHLDQNGMLIVATHRELKVATHLVIRICLS
ncbi:MAG: cytochrome c biogenesis heme-transporting ATPase CcmA [Gammaproteobacteria bacterium]|jgi:heme exporter protein A|nr:cytochrome c biogenesis heme-transporting ATPase CcmA [Gammaproteobacteria bacterium]